MQLFVFFYPTIVSICHFCTFVALLSYIKMISVIAAMLSGILFGHLLRKQNLWFVQPCVTAFIWLLLWLLGIEVGSNEMIMKSLHTLGLEALIITMAGTLASVTAAMYLWKNIEKRKQKLDEKGENVIAHRPEQAANAWQGSVIIVLCFTAGVLCGLFHIIPFDTTDSKLSLYALYALVFSAGMSMGSDPMMINRFRSLNKRLMLLPLFTIVSTLLGTAVIGLILNNRPLTDYLAVGSGFGYYSLSSVLITEMRGAELGTIALLANICRELITMLFAPLLMRWFGKLAPISAGGATSLDSTLPIIVRTCGNEFVMISFFHGFLVDFSVPFLVTLFCSL